MTRQFGPSDDLRQARFVGVDLSGAQITDADLSGADISGWIDGLVVNGVEVAPLVTAELDRRHPERLLLRPTDADGMRMAWVVVGQLWHDALRRAAALPEVLRHERVQGEWSLVETLRHLVFATDAWFGSAVRAEPHPFHPIGLPHSSFTDTASLGLHLDAPPSYTEVLAIREERRTQVQRYLEDVTDDELSRLRPAYGAAAYPPPSDDTVRHCLLVLLEEEWAHHQYVVRDLPTLEQQAAGGPGPPG